MMVALTLQVIAWSMVLVISWWGPKEESNLTMLEFILWFAWILLGIALAILSVIVAWTES